jgi:hypothetical protein
MDTKQIQMRAAEIYGERSLFPWAKNVMVLSIANHSASLPIAYRLYLPETSANDAARRKKTHVDGRHRCSRSPFRA